MWAFPPSREATTPLQTKEIRASAQAASQGGLLSTKARRVGATVDTQFNRRGGDADQGDAIERESAVQWKPATTDQRAEMVRQLATTTLWQLYMSQSAAHDEIHVASARDEWLAESQADLAVFARRKFKAGELVLLPFNHSLVEGTFKRPVGAMPLEMVITPDGEKATRVAFWVKPLWLPKRIDDFTAAIVPFWLLTKTQQAPKSQGKAASQGSLIYAIAEVDVPSPAAIVKGGRDVKSKVTMRIPYLTNDMSLDKGARLFVKGNMLAAWAQTENATATEDDTA